MKTQKTSNQSYGSHFKKPKEKVGRSTIEYLEALDHTGYVHEQEKIAQRERHGLFSHPIGLAPGDAYKDPAIDHPEKRVEVNTRMQQKVGPQLFSKMISTNQGDPYKDPFRANQLYLKQKNDLSIHPKGFNAGGRQKLVKHSEFQHQKDYDDKKYNTRGADGKVVSAAKGIMTNNMRKGYGNTSVGHLFGSYPYMGYPEDDPRAMNSNDRLLHKAKIPTPFKNSSHPSKTFTPDYALKNTEEPYKPKNEDAQYRPNGPNNWRYNNPNKKGFNGTFTAFPKYIEEGEKEKPKHKDEGVWVPNFNGTSKGLGQTLSRPTPPISQMNINQMRRHKG